uniref:Uncharacterized protein n=1 Tax=Anguilla anguilla TaxID=7936 RepID=A0A0E9R992_ANGAN
MYSGCVFANHYPLTE